MVHCLAAIDRLPAAPHIYRAAAKAPSVYALPSNSQHSSPVHSYSRNSSKPRDITKSDSDITNLAASTKSQLKSFLQTINMCFACVDERDNITKMGYEDNARDIDQVDNR